MAIGKKVGSMKNLKNTLKKGAMGPIRYIPKNGSLTVRFLEEPEHWVNYHEHYDSTMKRSYPCIEDGCPGCATDERRTSRYLANALDVESDRVIALQMPKDLTNQLVRKYERNDTLMDRDYELIREGEGLDTTYDCEAEPPLNRKLTKYTLLDLQDVLDDVFQSVFGEGADDDDDDDDDDDGPAPKRGRISNVDRRRKRSRSARDDDDDDDDPEDDDDDDEPQPRRKRSKFAPPARDEDVDEDDDPEEDDEPDDEPDDDDPEEDDEPEELTEDDLNNMTVGELRELCRDYDIDPKGMKKAEMIDALLEEGEEEPF